MPYYQACFALPQTLSHEKFLLQDRGLPLCDYKNPDNNCRPSSTREQLPRLSDQRLLIPLHQACLSLLHTLAPNLTPLWVHKTDYHSVLAPDYTRRILLYAQSHLAHATPSALDDQPLFYALSADGKKTTFPCPPDPTLAPPLWASWSALATITPDGACLFEAIHINIHPSFLQTHLDATFFFAQQLQAPHQHFALYEKQVQLQAPLDIKKKAQFQTASNQKKIFMRIRALRHRFLAKQHLSVIPYGEPAADTSHIPLSPSTLAPTEETSTNKKRATHTTRHTLFSALSTYTRTFTNRVRTGLHQVYHLPLWQQCTQFVTQSLPNRISRWLLFLLASCFTILLLRSLCRMVLIHTLLIQHARFAPHFFHVRHFPTYLFRLTRKANLLCACYFSRPCIHSPTLRQKVFFTPKPILAPTSPIILGSPGSCSVRLHQSKSGST